MRFFLAAVAPLLFGASLFLGGCETPPAGPAAKPVAGQDKTFTRLPLGYQPLPNANDCYVESVHFYDFYLANRLGGPKSWARIMRWATRKDDFTYGPGHAVTVFLMHGRLWIYDLNFGFLSLETSPDRRMDLTEVAPEIFAKYPAMKSLFASYDEDYPQPIAPGRATYTPEGTEGNLKLVLTVAETLGKVRPTSVVEFEYPAEGVTKRGAAVAFVFGKKLWFYHPVTGTLEQKLAFPMVDDLSFIARSAQQLFPGAKNVRWYKPAVPASS